MKSDTNRAACAVIWWSPHFLHHRCIVLIPCGSYNVKKRYEPAAVKWKPEVLKVNSVGYGNHYMQRWVIRICFHVYHTLQVVLPQFGISDVGDVVQRPPHRGLVLTLAAGRGRLHRSGLRLRLPRPLSEVRRLRDASRQLWPQPEEQRKHRAVVLLSE